MSTARKVDELTERTIKALGRLTPEQRDAAMIQILRSDSELGCALPTILASYVGVKRLRLPLRRDSVV